MNKREPKPMMTARMREVHRFIRGYHRKYGLPPTRVEIAEGIGLAVGTVQDCVAEMIEEGYLLEHGARRGRALMACQDFDVLANPVRVADLIRAAAAGKGVQRRAAAMVKEYGL